MPLNRLPEEFFELCGIARLREKVGTRKEYNVKGFNRRWTELQGQRQLDESAIGKTMASDDRKAKTNPASKSEASPKNNNEAAPKNKSVSAAELSKAKVVEKAADSPSSYSRGEGQKPVSKAYKENWNAIFAKKKKR